MRLLERSAFTSWNVAAVLDELGRHAEGLAVIERGVADAEMMRLFEDSTRARHVVDVVHTQRAQALAAVGRFDEAVAQARAELDAVKATAAASPGSFEAARAIPVVLRPVGEVYLAAGRRDEACAAFAEARRDWQALAGRAGMTGFDVSTEVPVLDRELTGVSLTRRDFRLGAFQAGKKAVLFREKGPKSFYSDACPEVCALIAGRCVGGGSLDLRAVVTAKAFWSFFSKKDCLLASLRNTATPCVPARPR